MLVTSFDFGLTEPLALRDWLDLDNVRVLVAGAQRLQNGSLIPSRAFHPKMYAFGKNDAHSVCSSDLQTLPVAALV